MTPNEGHMASHIGRRKFLATLGGAAAAWPVAAQAREITATCSSFAMETPLRVGQ
jgi:hypothetical protein